MEQSGSLQPGSTDFTTGNGTKKNPLPNPLAVGGFYTYSVPAVLEKEIREGKLVIVPFAGNKKYTGLVCRVHETEPVGYKKWSLSPGHTLSPTKNAPSPHNFSPPDTFQCPLTPYIAIGGVEKGSCTICLAVPLDRRGRGRKKQD